jgi:hypothetical protein
MSSLDDDPEHSNIAAQLQMILDNQNRTLAQITTINGHLDSHDRRMARLEKSSGEDVSSDESPTKDADMTSGSGDNTSGKPGLGGSGDGGKGGDGGGDGHRYRAEEDGVHRPKINLSWRVRSFVVAEQK